MEKYAKYLIPGIVLQSVLIGGGYATGREIVEFGGKFGALGWISGLLTFVLFAIVAVVMFEIARIYKAYDYKSVLQPLIGKGWILFDIIYVLMLFLIIAVMASATGEILMQTVGLPVMYGISTLIIVVGALNFFGSSIIVKFETYGTIALYIAYLVFAFVVITGYSENISRVFSTMDTSFTPGVDVTEAVWTGIVYASYNLIVMPAALFTLRGFTKRRESIISGIIGAFLMIIPWFLTYFALMGFYPDKEVIGNTVPWLAMLMKSNGGAVLVLVFGVVAGWTLIETATGMIHALIERIDEAFKSADKKPLQRMHRMGITVAILIVAMMFAQIGIIDLIAKGYSYLSYGIIIVYLLPLLTIGVVKVVKAK